MEETTPALRLIYLSKTFQIHFKLAINYQIDVGQGPSNNPAASLKKRSLKKGARVPAHRELSFFKIPSINGQHWFPPTCGAHPTIYSEIKGLDHLLLAFSSAVGRWQPRNSN